MVAKKNALTLRITGPDGQTVESRSDLDNVILGSGTGAAVQVKDPKVSNMHLMLKVDAHGTVTAIDLGSEHGTRIGSEVIRNPVSLSSGDILNLGTTRVEVLFGEGAQPIVASMASSLGGHGQGNNALAGPPSLGSSPVQLTRTLLRQAAVTAESFRQALPAAEAPTEASKVLQVAQLWGNQILNVRHFADGQTVTIGEARESAFSVFSPAVGQSFKLVTAGASKLLVNVPADARVSLYSGGTRKTTEVLRKEGRLLASDGAARAMALELTLHERLTLEVGAMTLVMRYVRPSPLTQVDTFKEADFTFLKIIAVALFLFLAVVAAFVFIPGNDNATADQANNEQSQYVKMLFRPERKAPPEKKELSGVEEGAKAKGEEGKFGKEEAKKQEADPSKKGSPVVDPNKREEDRKKVMKSGLLGALGGASKGSASNVFGPGGLGTGINNALGGLKGGAGLGDAQGVGGMGSRGTGTGGGGTGLG